MSKMDTYILELAIAVGDRRIGVVRVRADDAQHEGLTAEGSSIGRFTSARAAVFALIASELTPGAPAKGEIFHDLADWQVSFVDTPGAGQSGFVVVRPDGQRFRITEWRRL
ncbi:MAG: hypothetical protein WAW96_00120 [Alphaproteobacteria bacterium]